MLHHLFDALVLSSLLWLAHTHAEPRHIHSRSRDFVHQPHAQQVQLMSAQQEAVEVQADGSFVQMEKPVFERLHRELRHDVKVMRRSMWSDHAHPAPILDPLDATMLTLSNTAYLGTGVVAASIGLYYEATLFATVGVVSGLYHFCDNGLPKALVSGHSDKEAMHNARRLWRTHPYLHVFLGGHTTFCHRHYWWLHRVDHALAFYIFLHMALITVAVDHPQVRSASRTQVIGYRILVMLIISLLVSVNQTCKVTFVSLGLLIVLFGSVYIHFRMMARRNIADAGADLADSAIIDGREAGDAALYIPVGNGERSPLEKDWAFSCACGAGVRVIQLVGVLVLFFLGELFSFIGHKGYGGLHSLWHLATASWAAAILIDEMQCASAPPNSKA